MAFSSAIQNIGEYYSPYYLDAAFDEDSKKYLVGIEGQASVVKALAGIGEKYFQAKEELFYKRGSREAQIQFQNAIKQALGYSDVVPTVYKFADSKKAYLLSGLLERKGESWLAVLEPNQFYLFSHAEEGKDPLEDFQTSKTLPEEEAREGYIRHESKSLSKLVGEIFAEEGSPRFVLVLGGGVLYLFDKHVYAEGRYLLFDLEEAYGRKEESTFRQMATLLSRERLASEDNFIHDNLEDNSHKYAFGVTEKLQFAVREAIVLLANEWVEARKTAKLSYTKVDGEDVTAERLKHEALVYIYRILFCLYAEAKGKDSGLLPISNDVYRLGYSFESLRDLELIPLETGSEAANGTYFHEHLLKLFAIIQHGFPTDIEIDALEFKKVPFQVPALTSQLFDERETKLLDQVKLRNKVLQDVVVRLSLSEDAKGRSRGRINYADLGINQLGAVYEGILSYSAKFAETDLIQVGVPDGTKAPNFESSSTQTWFVPKTREGEFPRAAIEMTSAGSRMYAKGSFILYLSHVDRERTASYYTPEVLTRCLVEEALEELVLARPNASADEVLSWKICEPAMGSGAFLNEACEQLSALYLKKKQEELGVRISPEDYQLELRRVKYHIATRNVYGVDLNPMAVELGSLSLWLGTEHRRPKFVSEENQEVESDTSAVPWFGLRLRAGNSLIGARRAVWKVSDLRDGSYLKEGSFPRTLLPGETRNQDEVYHFLVFDPEMVPVRKDKLFKEFYPKETKASEDWAKQNSTGKWEKEESDLAIQISDLIEKHWHTYTEERNRALKDTESTATVWPISVTEDSSHLPGPGLKKQEETKEKLESSSGSFQRLKVLMDVWCALYFWPVMDLEKADQLPSRRAFLYVAKLLLGDSLPKDKTEQKFYNLEFGIHLDMVAEVAAESTPSVRSLSLLVPWVGVGVGVAEAQRFHHWELVFPEVLGPKPTHAGFALMLGNPPWLTSDWQDFAALNEIDPLLAVSGSKSAVYNAKRPSLLNAENAREYYFHEFLPSEGSATFLNSERNYSELKGLRTNLYKNFIVKSWTLLARNGICGLLHPTGVFDDPNGGKLREEYFHRLKRHYQFVNENSLFQDVHHLLSYALNVFIGSRQPIRFLSSFNLYHPKTLFESKKVGYIIDEIPGMKTASGNWELRGHPDRFLEITETELSVFADLFKAEEVKTTKLPRLHTKALLNILTVISKAKHTLSDLSDVSFSTDMYNETNAQKDGVLQREEIPSFQSLSPREVVITGPMIYVGNPLYGSAYTACTHNNAYNDIDLSITPDSLLSRSPYRLLKNDPFFVNLSGERVNAKEYFRVAWRDMAASSNERTLMSAIIPKYFSHIYTIQTFAAKTSNETVFVGAILTSIIADYLFRFTGAGHARIGNISFIPLIQNMIIQSLLIYRTLRLNCLTKYYAELWEECAIGIAKDSFVVPKESYIADRLHVTEFESPWKDLKNHWDWNSPLRTDYARRWALLEIDVLVAMGMGLSLEQLQLIYRLQFGVSQQYERVDQYDSKGRRLPNTTRKDPGGKELREAIKARTADGSEVTTPITIKYPIDGGTHMEEKTFYPPFVGVDRMEEYRIIWQGMKDRV
ncbi:hypothetical protein JWG41_18120 [Leptospira sp. 201903075]|uniref:hypothetical protein n=1 Tax=Leptospira chreensis TaxID=2810035 RepID=UPI001966AA0F|nr:hypothetical protein [Leptospira chreensis]MBM9592366.1 hypothetical protein [Leptospira chreensis]